MDSNIWAYSGISQPIRTYSTSGSYFVGYIDGTARTLDLNIVEDGVLMGFLSFLNLTALEVAPGPGGQLPYITITLSRNGQTLLSSRQNVSDYSPNGGLAFYETLNVLSGAEVKAGEVFRISVVSSNPYGGQSETYTMGISAVLKSQQRQFSV